MLVLVPVVVLVGKVGETIWAMCADSAGSAGW